MSSILLSSVSMFIACFIQIYYKFNHIWMYYIIFNFIKNLYVQNAEFL